MNPNFSSFLKQNTEIKPLSASLVDNESPFAVKEAYRALYTNILYLNIEDKCKKIVVTSAVSGEGKTTLSVNIALTLAQNLEGKRVLLIDADMRRPCVAKMLSLGPRTHGLSEFLAGIDKDPHIDYIPQYKLAVLSAGGKNVNPTKLVGSENMKRLITACEKEFDYIIIDTPPVTVVTDAILLNNIANGYVIAARADHSNINKISECVSKLEQVGAEIFGMIFLGEKIKKYNARYMRYDRYSSDQW